MSAERPSLPPVRLNTEAELARDALAAPLFVRAVRLARWAGPDTRVGAGGELVEDQLPAAAEHLGLAADEDGAAYASEAWRLAVDTGLLDVTDPEEGEGGDDTDGEGAVTTGENLALLTGGSPQDVLAIWLDGLDAVHADATAPVLDDFADLVGEDGSIDFDALDWDPEAEAEFLDGVLGNLYLLTLAENAAGEGPVPLPALAASMIVPDDMGEPTDDILEQVSEAMMRLDDQFRLLEPIGIVEYRPVDEALLVEEGESADASAAGADDEDVTRYGMVKLTPLGLYGIRARMLEAGVDAPAVGDLAGKGADALLDGIAHYPESAARAEVKLWLAGYGAKGAVAAAAEILAAARGRDEGG
ncbi:hypothetical protein, partial [Streptomyces sp. OspMP-M43]|uniref:hypothetical protein n=1 Tax=Streptomyces sp. OspMP-M43 TaxID=1839781 RepID=UPI00081BC551